MLRAARPRKWDKTSRDPRHRPPRRLVRRARCRAMPLHAGVGLWIVVTALLLFQHLARDDDALHFRRALVDGGDPRVPVVALGRELVDVAVAAVDLDADVARLVRL